MKKWQIIDLVRSFSIVSVMAGHTYVNFPFPNRWEAFIWGRFCNNSIYGVFLFFFVSGFLITNVIANYPGGLFKPDIVKFYVQRIGRIWPLYYLCIAVGVIAFLFLTEKSPFYTSLFPSGGSYGMSFWLSVPTFTFNWFLVANIDRYFGLQWLVLWSLAVEEQFYFLFPPALKKLKNEKNLVGSLLFIIIAAFLLRLMFYVFNLRSIFFIFASPLVFDLIAGGILFHLAYKRFGTYFSNHKLVSSVLFAFGAVSILFIYLNTRMLDAFDRIYVPEGLLLGVFCLLMGGLHLPFFESKYLKIPSLPGKYCYGCYLLHSAVNQFIQPFLAKVYPVLGLAYLVILTTLIAAVSFHAFEMPVNHLIRKTLDRVRRSPS